MAEKLIFSIGPDGDVTVRSYDELQKWLEKERAQWAWLVRGDPKVDRHNIATNTQNQWDNLLKNIQNLENQGQPLEDARGHLAPLSDGPLLVSTTKKGTSVLDVRNAVGEPAAAFAFGFQTNQFNVQNAQNQEDLLGAILTVFPNLNDDADWHERLKRERANFKMATRSAIERVDKEASERIESNIELVERASGIARRIFDKKRERWKAVQLEWQKAADKAVQDIRATEAAYLEFMKLKAPVEYWEGKATEHETREGKARTLLYWYFPLTILAMLIAFGGAGWFLVSHPNTEATQAPIALYVVISGGLLLFSTIAFWIGRILTKLYLSEHHLRNDAEERAVMTTTYLALTSENAATDEDRQIVLNALFRATPDGIVKDDGPTDASLQGLIARMAAR
ncbi:DUF6161 domain-containing protein [Qipengyuania nanhaisediminis]|uniref:DUF6161 domain-containing protein n=1 Tax=Qipengyuania nanhaisediminis TaxID=604088 RepID=UPI0038B23746